MASPDYRTRVARERRARTRERILEAALGVFAARGPDAPVVRDFIEAAGVARGTFYNYYDSVEALLEDTTRWLEDDLMMSIERELAPFASPADRLTLGVRLWLRKAETDPVWCAFVAGAVKHGESVERTLEKDLRDGSRAGMFSFGSVEAARDVVVGTLHEAMRRMALGGTSTRFTRDVARAVFRGLGMPPPAVEAAIARRLPAMRRETRKIP